jgi:hypothetical protein
MYDEKTGLVKILPFSVASLTFSERQYFGEWSKIPKLAFCNDADWL